jgi:cyclase
MEMTIVLGSTMKILRPHPSILAFYDGRIAGQRLHSPEPNWLDDAAYTLGVCSYAIIDGASAILFDTHISLPHARLIRSALEGAGVTDIRVVLSHHHADHIAGNEIFADCEIIASRLTVELLRANRDSLEARNPPINPLIMPTTAFDGTLSLTVGDIPVDIMPYEIHSRDGHVAWLPAQKILLAGDTLEDPVTFVAEPERLVAHLTELARLSALPIDKILPAHGVESVIDAGGYDRRLIAATSRYVTDLLRCKTDSKLSAASLKDFAEDLFAEASIYYCPAYEDIHRENVRRVTKL